MSISKRQEEIINILKYKAFASTEDLITMLRVSPITVRRDLNSLAKMGKILRVHGGATISSGRHDVPYIQRMASNFNEKRKIAACVADFIPDGSSIFIDIGTTPEIVSQALANKKNLFVLTNSLNVAHILYNNNNITLNIVCGEVRNGDGGILGDAARDYIAQYKTNYAILGIGGIDNSGNLLNFTYSESAIAREVIKNTNCVILPVDHTKFGRKGMVLIDHISKVDYIFTDQPLLEQFASMINPNDTNVVICDH